MVQIYTCLITLFSTLKAVISA